MMNNSIRRLLPEETEALQGFPKGYTKVPIIKITRKGKQKYQPPEKCPDGPRYKAIGNSWAVPVAAWIGRRIQMVEDANK